MGTEGLGCTHWPGGIEEPDTEEKNSLEMAVKNHLRGRRHTKLGKWLS
jgi:hypothetical protein